ncbi:MAG: hypothetical protein AAFV53_16135 [Myxococcota bacterium]
MRGGWKSAGIVLAGLPALALLYLPVHFLTKRASGVTALGWALRISSVPVIFVGVGLVLLFSWGAPGQVLAVELAASPPVGEESVFVVYAKMAGGNEDTDDTRFVYLREVAPGGP